MHNWRWNPINGVLVFQTLLLATRTENLYISLEEVGYRTWHGARSNEWKVIGSYAWLCRVEHCL